MTDLQQSFREVKSSGPPVKSLDFPTPLIYPAVFLQKQTVINHHHFARSNTSEMLYHRDVSLLCRAGTMSNVSSHNAYWMKKTLSQTSYGNIQLGTVVRRRCANSLNYLQSREEEISAEWITTDEIVAIKVSSNVRNCGDAMVTNGPLKEAACLQLVGNYHPNILGCIEVLQDDENLFTILPYCPGGKISSYISSHCLIRSSRRSRGRHHGRTESSETIFSSDASSVATPPITYLMSTEAPSSDRTSRTVSTEGTPCREFATAKQQKTSNEAQVRIWFLQLLEALRHLQMKGVCHRNIQSSNILIESKESNNLVLIDFTSAVRVPYKDDTNLGGVADVSQGTYRLLIQNDKSLKPRATVARTESRSRNARPQRSTEPLQYRKQSVPPKSSFTSSYSAPELLEGQPYDGFTVDLWSTGVFLYVMLVGLTPFQTPNEQLDAHYRQVNRGQLRDLILSSRAIVSDAAIDLLQNMLWHDPQRRLSLNEVFLHPWITGVVHPSTPLTMTEEMTEGMAAVSHSNTAIASATPPRWYSTRRLHSSSGASGTKEPSTPKTTKKTRNL